MGISFKLLFQRNINYCNFSSFETQASTSKQMKSLLVVLAVLPLHSWMLNGRYLLVDINENFRLPQNLTETVGYSFEYNFDCTGSIIQFAFSDFQDAKRECDADRIKCGCIDTVAKTDCATNPTSQSFTIHSSFRIKPSKGQCAWVKS